MGLAPAFLLRRICEAADTLPFEAGCLPRPASASATVPGRKVDLEGVMATDAVAVIPCGAPLVRHSFDFGDAGRLLDASTRPGPLSAMATT